MSELEDKINLKLETLKGKYALLEKEIKKLQVEVQEKNNVIINKRVEITAVDKSIQTLEELL